jgi:hypothetical protein
VFNLQQKQAECINFDGRKVRQQIIQTLLRTASKQQDVVGTSKITKPYSKAYGK